MGTTRASQDDLADKIARPANKTGRYDYACKAEVGAYVNRAIGALSTAITEEIEEQGVRLDSRIDAILELADGAHLKILKLEARIRELELTRWQRFKRWANDFIEDVMFAVTADPSEFPMDDRAVILPHGSQAELDTEDAKAFAIEAAMDGSSVHGLGAVASGACEFSPFPTECAEDLADNPLIAEAIEHIKAFEGEQFNPNRYSNLTTSHPCAECGTTVYPGTILREPGSPQYVELEERRGDFVAHVCVKPQHDLGRKEGYLVPGKFTVGARVEIPPPTATNVDIDATIAAIEAHTKYGTPLPRNIHRLSIPPAITNDTLGDPEE